MNLTILILAALLAIGSPSLSLAECARVLWESEYMESSPRGGSWEVHQAFENLSGCEEGARARVRLMYSVFKGADFERAHDVAAGEYGFLIHRKGSAESQPIYVFKTRCLPDTIDPRDKKE